MNATVMAIILVLIVVATVVTKKVPLTLYYLLYRSFVRYFWALAYRRQVTLYWSSSVRS